ncbi:MAG: hypothetical protein WC082_06635 [Victivallales bacterium]
MTCNLKFSVGYYLPDLYKCRETVEAFSGHIEEVYFPWLDLADGRGNSIRCQEEQEQMLDELKAIHKNGIRLNMLLNANCYGEKAISVNFAENLFSAIDNVFTLIGLEAITTTSLFAAQLIKKRYPELEIKASVNMGIGTVPGMEYVKNYFDSFYLQRELNRTPHKIKKLKEWCVKNGKKLYMLANSGCLRFCSAHTFHDNLVAHEREIACQENAWTNFRGVCWQYLADPQNELSFLRDSTWVRPEDIDSYKGLVDGIKLATRSHRRPEVVIESYVSRKHDGNMLSLCEPDFSGLGFIDNSRFPASWQSGLNNLPECEYDNYCKKVMKNVKR